MSGLILEVVLFLVATFLALIVLSRHEEPRAALERYRRSSHGGASIACAFEEICHSVLNPHSLSFVSTHAPAEARASFEVEQQRLARFSLQLASTVLLERLIDSNHQSLGGSLSSRLRYSVLTTKGAFLLAACALGRMSLGVPRSLHAFALQRMQVLYQPKFSERLAILSPIRSSMIKLCQRM